MNKCFYCEDNFGTVITHSGTPLSLKTRDHIIPLSKGGNSSPLNMVGACGHCNTLKGNKLPEVLSQFLLEEIGTIKNRIGNNDKGFLFTRLQKLEVILNNNNLLIEKIRPYRKKLFRSYTEPGQNKKPPKRSLVFEYSKRNKLKVDKEVVRTFSETISRHEAILIELGKLPNCNFHYE